MHWWTLELRETKDHLSLSLSFFFLFFSSSSSSLDLERGKEEMSEVVLMKKMMWSFLSITWFFRKLKQCLERALRIKLIFWVFLFFIFDNSIVERGEIWTLNISPKEHLKMLVNWVTRLLTYLRNLTTMWIGFFLKRLNKKNKFLTFG